MNVLPESFKPNEIDARNLKALRDLGREHTIIDVRTPREFEDCRLPNAMNIPYDMDFARRAKRWIPERGVIVVYGEMADTAARRLVAEGRAHVRWLRDGIAGWLSESMPVERSH